MRRQDVGLGMSFWLELNNQFFICYRNYAQKGFRGRTEARHHAMGRVSSESYEGFSRKIP